MCGWGVEQALLEPPSQPLTGDSHSHLIAPLQAFAESLGFTVSFEFIDGPAAGWCDQKAKRIVLDTDAPANARLRTLIHEIGHALGIDYGTYRREVAEVLVDTVTYVVCAGVGLDVGGEVVPYVAGWGEDEATAAVTRFADHRSDRQAHRSGNRTAAGRARRPAGRRVSGPRRRGWTPRLGVPRWTRRCDIAAMDANGDRIVGDRLSQALAGSRGAEWPATCARHRTGASRAPASPPLRGPVGAPLTPGRSPGGCGLTSAPDHPEEPMPNRPTPKQLRLLRTLAVERGETFAVPQTKAEAARLKARDRSARSETALDRREVSHDLARAGDAATPQSHELVGHGGNAHWAGREETTR